MRMLKPHQAEGIGVLSIRQRLILADDMGLGKTIQAARAALELRLPGTYLVVHPASARAVWSRELALEDVPATDIFRMDTGKAYSNYAGQKWFLVSLPLFRDHFTNIIKKIWPVGLFILDEAHMIKNIQSKSNKAATPLAMRVPVFWPLTGTPVKNDYSELYALARLVVPPARLAEHGVSGFYDWRDKFCILEKEQVWKYDPTLRRSVPITITKIAGSQNPQLLKKVMNGTILRRRKAQVLKDLPEMRWQELFIDGINLDIDSDELAEMEYAAEHGGTGNKHISTKRIEWSMAAVPRVVDTIVEHVEADSSPMIVFSNYLEPIHLLETVLKKEGIGVATITGSTTPKQRETIVDDFQNGKLDVLLGQTLAAGTAITLTRANRVLFLDLAWSPADNAQARDRAHRIGQDKEVLAQYVVSDDALSERVTSILARKVRDLEALEG